eukprot:5173898-Ditylum_brightwellii.AAC.1
MELYANAIAVPTMLRSGAHGHISLVMDKTLYTTLPTTVYAAPAQPIRATLSPRATVVDQETMEHQYKLEKVIYDNHNMVEEVVKAQIQEAIKDIFLRQLKNKYTRYMGVTSRHIIDHLLDWYGKSTPSDLTSNSKRFQEGVDMSQPTNAHFTCIYDCIQYATDGNIGQILTITTFSMLNTGFFREALRMYKAKAAASKTWETSMLSLQMSIVSSEKKDSSLQRNQAFIKPISYRMPW